MTKIVPFQPRQHPPFLSIPSVVFPGSLLATFVSRKNSNKFEPMSKTFGTKDNHFINYTYTFAKYYCIFVIGATVCFKYISQETVGCKRRLNSGSLYQNIDFRLNLSELLQNVILVRCFTALHGMQTRYSDENSVCLFVCLSNACIVTKRKKDLFRFLHHTKDHLA